MEALELRERVLKYIDSVDEQLLKEVKAFIENYQKEETIAFTVNGRPLNKREYQSELLASIAEIKRGEYCTQEDLEKESENW